MTLKKITNKTRKIVKSVFSDSNKIGVDRNKAQPRPSNKSFSEAADLTFKRHEKSFEKLAE